MKETHPLPVDPEDGRELFDNLLEVASATECTGLIPAAPEEESEARAYSEIYDIPLATVGKDARQNLQSVQQQEDRR